MHALLVRDMGVHLGVDEQYAQHHLAYGSVLEEFHLGIGSNNVLIDSSLQFAVFKELTPGALVFEWINKLVIFFSLVCRAGGKRNTSDA